MAISTETENLIRMYEQKKQINDDQLDQIDKMRNNLEISNPGIDNPLLIPGPNAIIQLYGSSIEKIDKKIVELNLKIVDLRQTILSIGQSASAAGCGSTATVVEVSVPSIECKVYSFDGDNPFEESTEILNYNNSGVGVENKVITTVLGTYNGDISICNELGIGTTSGIGTFFCSTAPGGSCVAAAASITYFESQIPPIQSERNDLISKVNFLKKERMNSQLQDYAYSQAEKEIQSQNQDLQVAIDFLKDTENEEWL